MYHTPRAMPNANLLQPLNILYPLLHLADIGAAMDYACMRIACNACSACCCVASAEAIHLQPCVGLRGLFPHTSHDGMYECTHAPAKHRGVARSLLDKLTRASDRAPGVSGSSQLPQDNETRCRVLRCASPAARLRLAPLLFSRLLAV